MGYQRLAIYYKTMFSLMNHHKWNLSEVEDLIPWEKQVYVDLLEDWIKQKEQEAKDQEQAMKDQMRDRKSTRLNSSH